MRRSTHHLGTARHAQRGVALLLAMFIAALATLIVSGLFWRQFVLLRTIENQQLVSQTRLLLRGALDWGRAILREDAARSSYDALSEPWAQPLAETRLSDLGETSALAAQATLEGRIEDAQSRLNLRNLVNPDGTINETEVKALRRLLRAKNYSEAIADLIAARMGQAFAPDPASKDGGDPPPKAIPLVDPKDLLGIRGIDPAIARDLADFVVVLDERTPVNFNTAPAEVIMARVEGLALNDARRLARGRERPYFTNTGDIRNQLLGAGEFNDADVSVSSRYFIISGRVKIGRADTRMQALVKRSAPGTSGPVVILWQHAQ